MSPEKLPIVPAKDQLQKAISAGSHPALMAARIPVVLWEGSGVGCGFCGFFDFADEDFNDVFEEEDSGGAAVVVDGSCDVGAGSPHGCEGVFEVGVVVDGGQAPDAFGGDRLFGGLGAGEVHDVFEV